MFPRGAERRYDGTPLGFIAKPKKKEEKFESTPISARGSHFTPRLGIGLKSGVYADEKSIFERSPHNWTVWNWNFFYATRLCNGGKNAHNYYVPGTTVEVRYENKIIKKKKNYK